MTRTSKNTDQSSVISTHKTSNALRRVATAAVLTAGAVAFGPATAAHAVSSGQCASAPSHSACDGAAPGGACTSGSHYVVGSVPLQNMTTGESSWNYGYVQLWWSDTCQTNWTRVVINVAGNWTVRADVIRLQGSPVDERQQYAEVGPGAYLSPMVYAADTLGCADGNVFLPVSGGADQYTGYYSQGSTC